MDSVKSQLEILNENSHGVSNYVSWRFKLNLALKTKDLFSIATGAIEKPAGEANDTNVKAWLKQDIDAQSLIGLNVCSSIANKISNCITAKSMLDKIANLYGAKTEVTMETLRRKFFTFEYDESKSAVQNCHEITQLAEELSTNNDPLRESWVMSRILCVLPAKLSHFRTAWDNVPANEKTVERLVQRLRLEDERQAETSDQEAHNALIVKQNKKRSQSGKQQQQQHEQKSGPYCNRCGQKGHFKKECKNRPCAKYLEYCKTIYPCNLCGQKGHFARECSQQGESNKSEGSNQDNRQQNRRALMTVGLTAAEMKDVKKENKAKDFWYQDCGATQHMTSRREWFSQLVELDQPICISIGDATKLYGVGVGNIELEAFDGQDWVPVRLEDVVYVPKLDFNLFSVGQTLDKGYLQQANSEKSEFRTHEGQIAAVAKREGNLFRMMFRMERTDTCLAAISIRVWHERLAHQNIKYVKGILKRHGIEYVDDWNDYVCEGCAYGKQHRIPHPANLKTAQAPLELVHVDMGEMNVPSLGGSKYFLLFKDDYSHYRTVYFMKHKDEAARNLEVFTKLVENQFNKRIKCLRSDNGLEIKNSDTRKLLEDLGTFHTFSTAYTPEQNGRIEREMRTVVESARSAIHAKGLNENLWAEAVNYAVFTINQTGTSTVEGKSPAELWFGRKLDVSKLKIFGCECFVLTPEHKRKKLDPKSEKGIFVGYNQNSSSYRIYMPQKRNVVSTQDVIFNENKDQAVRRTEIESRMQQDQEDKSEEEEEVEDESEEEFHESVSEEAPPPQRSPQQQTPGRVLRNRSNMKIPARYKDYIMGYLRGGNSANTAMIGEIQDISVAAALKDAKWRRAMKEEFNSLLEMKTWKLVECPEDVKPLTCKWVLREKTNGKLKARLVARGFEQREGIDYSETFSPVARHASIRLLLSYAASEKLDLIPFDVKTAFLHGDLKETIYMVQPEGFDDGSGRVCELKKSLYGLKQAPKQWNEKISNYLEQIGMVNTDDDPCIYYNHDKSILMSLFVDDGLIIGRNRQQVWKMLEDINGRFEITYDREVKTNISYLGMQIKVSDDGILVCQSKYTQKIISRMNFGDCNPASTPIEKGMVASPENFTNDVPAPANTPYREAIGSLLYLATITRPDISYAVNYLSRHCSKPLTSHWKMVKRIFQYLKGTVNFGIHFGGEGDIVAYTDSDYGGDPETMKSTSGILIMRGGPIVWYSQRQHLVVTSTAEAEYRAAVSAIDDICWLKRLAFELEIRKTEEPINLYIDNQSAVHMLQNSHEGKINKGKKHIEIPRKYIKQHVEKTISLCHINSADQLADIFTKPLSKQTFVKLRSKLVKEEC